ncbi:MAG: tetratricopeptide repeat protein, partial [Planctomycetota bacterium]
MFTRPTKRKVTRKSKRSPSSKSSHKRARRLAIVAAAGLTTIGFAAIQTVTADATAHALDLTSQLPEARTGANLPAYFDAADRAGADVEAGRFRLALVELGNVQDTRADNLRVSAFLALGNIEAARDAASSPSQLARVAEAEGDLAEARRQLNATLGESPSNLQARRDLGRLAEEAGDMEAALDAYAWFADEGFLQRWQRDPDSAAFERAEDVVAIAAALDRYATLTEGYRDDPRMHDVILGMFVRAYDVIDRGNTDAQLAAARFAYEKSDRKETADLLEAVLGRHPRNAAALQLLGRLSLDGYNFEQVKVVVGALRATNPSSRPADLLEARSMLLQRQAALAEPMLRRVLDDDPDHLEALGLLAAMHAVRLEQPAVDEILQQVEAIDPDNASAYFIIGEQLALLRQYDRAVDMLRIAIERAPHQTAARNELGATLTQAGREAAAVAALELAVAYDPFNASSLNYLKLLEDMAGYSRIDTEHFAVRWDPDHDPADAVAAEMWAEWLDEMHEDVVRLYEWTPDQPTQIQMFPTHDRFSVRVAGDPYVGTVGACTGPVIAMVVPKGGDEALGPYDWARVLRHEYVHTITLGATDNRIWHWLTEGIAVR